MSRSMPRNPTLTAVASAFPAQTVDREGAFDSLRSMFPGEDPRFIASLLERSGVGLRRVAPSIAAVLSDDDFTARNASWHEHALELSGRAVQAVLERARIPASAVDCLIDVSCTGIAIPALDVELVPRLGMRHDVRRVPITESGCAGGGLALGLANTLARGGEC